MVKSKKMKMVSGWWLLLAVAGFVAVVCAGVYLAVEMTFGITGEVYDAENADILNEVGQGKKGGFQLHELLGNNWQAACFLPAGYAYLNDKELPAWLSASLGREIREEDYIDMQRDGSGMKVLLTPAAEHAGLDAVPWQTVSRQEVICTQNPETMVEVVRNKDGYKGNYWRGYWLKHNFEKVYQLGK